ncbi:golgin subfamily B member 1-like [Polyodon spathula]|uniref:golgin subfamily B member 1-like n=1 Tax=Polyodon spathula TaxID=7913 RepID=UPI001B7EAC5C|nr:golgin subfamily B member 1-like [Polyodon spathula]
MWKWYSGDGSGPAQGAPDSQEGMNHKSMADVCEQLAQTEQLVVQLKELIREKDNALRTKDEQIKSEKEACEAKLSKVKLQNKAKVNSLNSQLDELKKQLTPSGTKEATAGLKKTTGDGNQENAAASRGKILVLKKRVEELESQLSQCKAELKNKNAEIETQRQRGSEMDAMLAEKDKKLSEKEAYIIDLQLIASGENPARALSTPAEEPKVQMTEKDTPLQDLQTLVKNLTKKVEESEEKYSILKEQSESLKELLVTEKKQFEGKENMYKENIQTFKDIIMEKENNLVEQYQKHEHELFKLAAKSDASAELEQLLKTLKQKLHEKEEVLLGRTQVVDVLQRELDTRDQQIKELNEKMKRLQVEKDNMQSKLDAEKHVMRAQLRDLMQKHETELKHVREKHETELSEKDQAYLQLQKELEEVRNHTEAAGALATDSTVDAGSNPRIAQLEVQAKLKTEEASKSEAKFLKMKAWSKSRIKQLEDELRKAQYGTTSLDNTALKNRVAELEGEREEILQKLEQYEELKTLNDELVAKLEIYEEQQRKMQADLEQVTKRAASQTSESGSADELQSHVLEWQDMVSDAEGVRDQAREEKAAMALRMTHIEEEREALVTRQQELEEELAQARGLRPKRGKQKQTANSTHNLQEDYEFDGKQAYQDPNNTSDSSDFADGENMGGWWPEFSSDNTGLRSVVEELELERNQLQEQILTLEERCQHLEDRLQLQARIESLQNENERLQGQLTNLRSQHNRDTEKHQVLISSLNEQLKGFSDREEILESSLIEKEQTLVGNSEKLEQIKNLRDSLKEKEVQNKELTDKLLQAEQNVAEFTGKCCTYEKQCSELKTSVADLTHRLSAAKEKTQKQDVAIEMLQRDLDQTNDELDKLNSTHLEERALLIHNLQSCEREIDNLKDVLLERDKEIAALSNSMTEYLDQVLQLKQQIKYKEEQVGGMETALVKAERQAQIIRESQSSDEETMNTKLASLVEELKEMEMELSNTREQNKAKCSEVEELLKQVHVGNEITQNLRTDIQKLNVTHRTHLAECETQLSFLKEQVTASSRRLQEVDTKNLEETNKLAAQLEETNTAYKNLKTLLQEKEKKEQSFETELKSFKDECNKLLTEAARKDEELLILSKQLAEQVEHQEMVKRAVHENLETISCLEEKLKVAQQEAEETKLKLSQKLQIKETECIQLKEQLEVKSESVLKLETEIKTLNNKNDQLQTIVEEKDNEILVQTKLAADLNEKAANVQGVNQNLQCRVNQLTNESEKLKRELSDQESLKSKQQDLVSELQGRISANEVHISEYEKTVAVMQKEKELLTSKTEDLVKLLEQNQNVVAEKLLDKTSECNTLAKLLSENQELITHLQDQVQLLTSQVDQLKCNIAEKEQAIIDKVTKCENLQSQLGQLQETLPMLQEQNHTLQSMLVEKDLLLQEKVTECYSLQKQINKQNESVVNLQNEVDSLKDEGKKLTQSLEEKEVALKSRICECNDLFDQIKRNNEAITVLSSQIDVMNEESVKLKSENEDLKTTLNNRNVDYSKLYEQATLSQTEAAELQSQVQILNAEIQDTKADILGKLNEIAVFQSELSKKEECIVLLNKQLDNMNTNAESLNISLQEKTESLNRQDLLIKQLQTKYMEEEGQLSENMAVIAQLQTQGQDMQKALQQKEKTLKMQQKEIKQLKDKAEESEVLKSQLNAYLEMITDLERQLRSMTERSDQLQYSMTEKEALLKKKVDDYVSLKAQFSDLEDAASQLRVQLEQVTTESDALKVAVKEKESNLKQTEESSLVQREELISKYQGKQTECESLKDQLSTLQQTASGLNEHITAQRSEINQLNETILKTETYIVEQTKAMQELQEQAEEAKLFKSQLMESTELISQLQSQVQKLISESKMLDKSAGEKQTAFSNLQEQYTTQTEQLREISSALSQKSEEISSLHRLISEKDDIIKAIENTSSTLKNEVEQLKVELEKNKVSYADLQQKDNALAAEIEVLKAENLEAVAQLNMANQAVEQRELVVQSLNSKYAEQLQNIESLHLEILSLNEKNSNMNKEMQLMTHSLQQQLDSALREKLVLKQDIDRTIAEKEELINNYSDQLQKKKDELQTCEQVVANLNEAGERLKNEKEQLQMQVSAKGEEVTGLKLEIQKIEQTLMDSEKEWLADRDNQKNSLLTEQLRSLANEMKSKDVKIQALQQDLDNMQEKFAEVSSALKMSSNELTEKNMVVADLSQHIAENQIKLEEMCLVVQKKDLLARQILSEREKEIKNLQTEKLSSQHDLSEFSQSMSEKLLAFEEEKFALQAAMKQLKLKHQSKVDSLKQELDRNTEVWQQKVSEMSEKDKYIQDERKQVCLLQQQVTNLQEQLDISTDKVNSTVKEGTQHLNDLLIKEGQIQSLTLQVNQQKELLTSISQQLREKDLSVTQVMESASNEMLKHREEKNSLIVQLEHLEKKHSCSTKELESLYQQLEEYKNTLSHSQALVQSKDVENQGLISENEQLKVQHDKLAKEKDLLKRKLQAALLVRKELIKKMEEFEKKSQDDFYKDKETADLQNIVQELTSQVTQAQTRGKEQESHLELLKQQILQKEADINEFARSLSTKATLVGHLEDNIRHLEITVLERETSLADALKAVMEKDAVIEALQCSSKENEKSFDNERCELKQEKELLQKKLHAALLARREAIKKAQEKERNLRAESTQQKEEFDKLLRECSQQAEELRTTKEQLTTIQQDYCCKLKEFENNREVIDGLQSQLNSINALLEEKEKSLQEVKMQLEELENKTCSALRDHDQGNTLKIKMSDMTSELENNANSQKTLEDDSKELAREIEQVRSELEKANIKITEKTEELLILQQTVNIAQQQHQQEKQVLIDECIELQDQLRKTQSDVEYFTMSLEDIKKEKDSQSEAFNNSNKMLLEANNELKEELEKVHSLIAEKSDECKAMKNTLAEMQHQFELEKVRIKAESEQMESRWKQSKAKTESYKLHLEKIEKEKEDIFCSLEKFREESVTLQEKLDESNRLKEEFSEKVYSLQSAAAQHEEKLFLLQSQTEKLQVILEEKENAILSLKSSISEKEELLAALELQMQKELHLHEVERGRVKTEIHELHRKAADMSHLSKEQSDVSKSNEQITRKLQAALISRKEALKENKSLKDKIQTLCSEKEELIRMSSSLEKSLADMKNQQGDLKVSITALSDEKEILISEVDKILSDNHSLSAACESLKHTIENITQQKQAFSCQLESLKDSETEELSEWKSKHKELKQEYESLLQAYENISSEMDKMRQLVETTRKEKQEVLSKRCRLETEKEVLEKQLNEAKEEQEKQKEKMRKFAKLKQQKIQELEEENEKIKNDQLKMAEKKQGTVKELALKKTELEEENKELQEICEKLRKKLNEIQSEKSSLLSDVEATRSSLEKLQVETKAQSDLQIKINEALGLKDLLAAELESQKADIVAKVEVIKTLQQEKLSLSEQVTELERQHKVELDKRDNTIAKLDSEINSNLQETISLNEKVRILDDDKSLLQEELENVQEISEKVKNENEYLETVLLKSAERLDLLTDTVSTLRMQNNLLSTQLSEIKEEKHGLIREKEGQQVKLVREFEEKLRAAQRGKEGSKSVTKELQELLREKHQEINQMQKDCIQYQELILDLEKSLKLSQSERDATEKELKSVNEKVSKFDDEIGNLYKEITSYKELLSEAKKQSERVLSENDRLKEELVQKEAQAELQKMNRKKELEQVNEQQKALYKNKLMKIEERINVLQREKERNREEVLQLKSDIESRDLLTKKLEKEANTNLSKLAAFSHTMSSLQNNGDSVADETKQWELRFQAAIEDKEKQCLDQKLAVLQLTEEMKIKDVQIREFQHKSSKLEVAFDETESRYKAAYIDFQKEKALLIATSRELSQNFEMLKVRFEEQKDHVQKLEEDKKALQHQLAESEDSAVQMKAELLTLEKRVTDTDSELQLSQSISDTLQVDLEKQEAIAKKLKSLLVNKDTEISMLLSSKCGEMSGYLAEIQNQNRIQIASYEVRLSALYDEKEKRDKAFRGLENRIKNLQVKYEKSVQEKEQMAAKMVNLKNALTSSQSDRDGLLSEYKVLEEWYQSVANEKAILSQEEETESKTSKQEIKTLLHQMDDLNSENALLKAQLIRYREDLNQVLSLKDNQLKQLLKKQLDSIKNLEHGKAVVEKQYQGALSDLEQKIEIIKSLESEKEKLGIQVQELEAIITTMTKEKLEMNETKVIADLQEKIVAKTTECNELKQNLDAQKATTNELKIKVKKIEKDTDKILSAAEAKYNKELSAFERDVDLMRNVSETAEERVAEISRDLMQAEQTILEAKTLNKELKSQNESFGKAMAALQNDRDKLIEDFKHLQVKYDDELKTASGKVNKLEFQLSDATSELNALVKERAVLMRTLSAFESDNTYNQLMVQIEDLRKAVADRDIEIKRFSSEKETYTRQMTAFSKSMASLQDDRDRLLQELGRSKRVYESRQGAASPVNNATDLNNCTALQADNGRLLEEITSLRSERMELSQMKSKAAELQKALQQADAFRLQTEQDVGAYQTELAELRTEKNLLLAESRSLKEQFLKLVADKDREISELQKLYPEESKKSSGVYPTETERVTLVANEDSSDHVQLLLTERIQLQSDLQRCLQEIHQRDLSFQQLNSKMMQTIEEKTNLTTQLKAVTQTLRDTQLHHNELQNRCYWLERQLQTRPIQASFQGHVQGEVATEVPPGAPQERASAVVDLESLEVGELRKRLTDTEQLYNATQQELSQLAESLSEEQARREAAEEALGLAEERVQSFDASSSRSAAREYSIQLESDDEREALIIDPTEHVVVRKMKGGALSVKRWLRGRSLYCSKLLTSRAKSRYLFLTYLLALHVAVFMCLTGIL